MDVKSYSSVYLWLNTERKLLKKKKHKDPVFDKYVSNCMDASYDEDTKDWTIHRNGFFSPLETIFDINPRDVNQKHQSLYEQDAVFHEDELIVRKYFIYKLLDINPNTRSSVDTFLRSDWFSSVESCGS